ncbi:MAG TPA: signal peptidase I [Nanoarchaeota archaeon]|nr:MAG: hypothetical protein QT01_C0002G0067 [archaeon GW2011_AR6]HIH18238.1 signal peptidase I [Nanoarchaeota archaeon]HIH50890.1 signal peptidase I [Nanoarchaeota archaeon]HIH65995.1 signal peptidase I [Nanoarchaeota archaeon]
MQRESIFRKFWNWLWNSNSILSWVVSFLLAFLIVRFIFYPVIGLLLGSSIPLVVIESGSMEHFASFDKWYEAQQEDYAKIGITEEQVQKWNFRSGLNKGDIAIIKGRDFSKIKVGDVIVFRPPEQKKAIIHRVVEVNAQQGYIATKGDANIGQLSVERKIRPEQLEGIAVLRIPFIGWIKLALVQGIQVIKQPQGI